MFNVYDGNGIVIGSCLDNINNLEGNGTWKIKAICSGQAKNIKSYKLTGFTSWQFKKIFASKKQIFFIVNVLQYRNLNYLYVYLI